MPQGGLSDWYGPTIYVGTDDEEQNADTGIPEPSTEEDAGLPSISIVIALIVTSFVAIFRRQR